MFLATIFLIYDSGIEKTKPEDKTKLKSLSVVENDVIILVLTFPDNTKDIFAFDALNKIYVLNRMLEKMKGIKNISSLVGASVVTAEKDEILVKTFIPQQLFLTNNEKKIQELRNTYYQYPELSPFISKNLKSCSFYIEPGIHYSSFTLYKQLEKIQKEYKAKFNFTFEFTGIRPIRVIIEKYLTKDMLYFLPIIFILIFLLLYLNFANIKVILLSYFIILLSSIFSYTAARVLNFKITPLIILAPAFNFGLLSDYLIHFFYHTKGLKTQSQILKARNRLIMPLFLTAVSTVIGFLSMMLLSREGHRFLGLFALLSIILTYILTMKWLPEVITQISPHTHSIFPKKKNPLFEKISKYFYNIFYFCIRYRTFIYLFCIIFILLSLYFLPRIIIQSYPVLQIPANSTVRKAETVLNDQFAGTIPFSIHFDTKANQSLIKRKNLLFIEKMQNNLSENKDIGFNYSFLTIIKRIHYYFNNSNPEYLRIPAIKDEFTFQSLIEQYLIFYSTTASPEEYESLLDSGFRHFSINGVLKYRDHNTLKMFLKKLSGIKHLIPSEWEFNINGPLKQLIKQSSDLRNNWIFSFTASLLLIFLTVLIYYKNLKLSLISMFPSLICVIITTGFIALFNIEIDIYTIIFTAITMGLTVDYTIHVIVAINELKKTSDLKNVSIHDKNLVKKYLSFIINYSGIPVFLSFLTSIFSFGILMFSSFKGARHFGLLISLSLIISIFFSVLILPTLLIGKSKIRDK